MLAGAGLPRGRPACCLDVLLGVADPPTAVMCYNDLAAVGLLAAAAKVGVQVPGAFSVIGYDDIPLSGYTVPALTTVEQPKAAMGREAVSLCLRVLCGESAANAVLQGQLILRESIEATAAAQALLTSQDDTDGLPQAGLDCANDCAQKVSHSRHAAGGRRCANDCMI